MVRIEVVKSIDALKDEVFVDVLETVLPDGATIEDAKGYLLEHCPEMFRVFHSDEAIGYFISEKTDEEGLMECHAYFYPSQRKYSVRGLKAIVEYNRGRGCEVYTSVLGNFPHVVRVLKSIGFSIMKVEDSVFTKKGIPYPIFHLRSNKEFNYE